MVDAPGGAEYTAPPSFDNEDRITSSAGFEEAAEEMEAARRKLLLISLQDSVVAISAAPVQEVLPAAPYARIPGAPACVAGVVNRRGRMLTVVDLGVALEQAPTAEGGEHRVVVVSWADREIGLAVRDVLQITSDWWADTPEEEDSFEAGRQEDRDEGYDPAGDERLRVVELKPVLAPLFGGEDHGAGEPTTE